jgi:hypothetical protein
MGYAARRMRQEPHCPECPECGGALRDPTPLMQTADGEIVEICERCEARWIEEGFLWKDRRERHSEEGARGRNRPQ